MRRFNEAAEDAFQVLEQRVRGFVEYIEAVRTDFVSDGMLPMDDITREFMTEHPDLAAGIINAALDFVAGMDGFKLRDPAGG